MLPILREPDVLRLVLTSARRPKVEAIAKSIESYNRARGLRVLRVAQLVGSQFVAFDVVDASGMRTRRKLAFG